MESLHAIAASLNRLCNRMQSIIGRGRVNTVNDNGVIQTMQISLNADEVRDNIPYIGTFGHVSNPPPGTDAAVVFIGGDRSNGAVIGTNNQQARMTGLLPGESATHDAFGKYIHFGENGITIEANGIPVTINNATSVTVNASVEVILNTPLLKVSGDIVDNYAINIDTMSGMREKYNTHTHGNVQNGSGNTGVPNILE